MIKVIFLDIDGVMNSKIFYEQRYKKRWLTLNNYTWRLKKQLKFILNGFKTPIYKYDSSKYDQPKYKSFEYVFNRLVKETDKLKWKWLSEFCNEHDYKICISSVWKTHFHDDGETNLEWWNKALVKLGFNEDIFIGITGKRRTLRGQEIKEFVDICNEGEKIIEKYVILDDDSDMLPEQLSTCYHQVDGYYGLTPNHLYRINRYFNKK